MLTGTQVVTGIDITDTILSNDHLGANDANTAAQVALGTLTFFKISPKTTSTFIVTVEASKLAFSTSTVVLAQDIYNKKPAKDIFGDVLTTFGNITTGVGAVMDFLPITGPAAKSIEKIGTIISVLGLGIKHSDDIIDGLDNLYKEFNEHVDILKNLLSQDLVNASAEVSAAWGSAKTSLLNTMDKVSDVINSMGTAAFDATVQLASDALNSTKAAFDNLVESSGIVLQSITETVIGNTVSIVVDSTSELVSYFSTNGTALSDTLSAAYWKFLDSIAKSLIDPLIIDLNNNGIALDSWQTSAALFDLNGNGTKENTGWTKANGDDAFLVIDKNSNGKIDDITEMFGNANIPGFTELAKYDSNKDNLINSLDSQFSLLRLWNDKNANGTVDTGEMTTLAANGITEISLNKYNRNTLIAGNDNIPPFEFLKRA